MLKHADVEAGLLIPLAVLALVDSTSFGTLLIPLWLLLSPGRPSPHRVLLFLGTVAVFYFALGVALLSGLDWFTSTFDRLLSLRPVRFVQLGLAIVLVVLGITIEPWTKEGKAKKAARRAARGPSRMQRWRDRAVSAEGSAAGVVALALTATSVEAASMVPYLGAIGLLTASGLGLGGSALVLAGYCFVMVLPALVMAAIRFVWRDRIAPFLHRVEGWMTRNSGEMTAWVLFLVGVYVLGDAVQALGLG